MRGFVSSLISRRRFTRASYSSHAHSVSILVYSIASTHAYKRAASWLNGELAPKERSSFGRQFHDFESSRFVGISSSSGSKRLRQEGKDRARDRIAIIFSNVFFCAKLAEAETRYFQIQPAGFWFLRNARRVSSGITSTAFSDTRNRCGLHRYQVSASVSSLNIFGIRVIDSLYRYRDRRCQVSVSVSSLSRTAFMNIAHRLHV